MHEKRETSTMTAAQETGSRRANEGQGRKVRANMVEESDNGIVCAEQRVAQEG
jgi:hypothetical protein